MATYNGSAYVGDQLRSILEQLGARDEVVVVDDASTDDTLDVVRSLDDDRIHVIAQPRNQGHVAAFESAIEAASGVVIMLSDQDDLWCHGRVTHLLDLLRKRPVAVGSLQVFGSHDNVIHHRAASDRTRLLNLLDILAGGRRAPYFGSAMAFDARLNSLLLPFPDQTEAHDIWLGIVGNISGGVAHSPMPVTLRREHGTNLTPSTPRPLRSRLLTRARMLSLIAIATARLRSR